MFKNYFNRRRILKTSGHKWFYTDKNTNFDFFYKFTKENDLTIMSFDNHNKTYREFILDEVIIKAMFEAVEGTTITHNQIYVNEKMTTPDIAKDYINAGFTLLKKTGNSKFANVAVLVKLSEFGKDKGKSLVLRRIVYNDTIIIGVDTLALPLNAVKSFVNKMENYFRTEREIADKGITQ
jgi:hypothetical protein